MDKQTPHFALQLNWRDDITYMCCFYVRLPPHLVNCGSRARSRDGVRWLLSKQKHKPSELTHAKWRAQSKRAEQTRLREEKDSFFLSLWKHFVWAHISHNHSEHTLSCVPVTVTDFHRTQREQLLTFYFTKIWEATGFISKIKSEKQHQEMQM